MSRFISIRFCGNETTISRLEGLVERIKDLHITYGIGCVFNMNNDLILRLKLKDEVKNEDLDTLSDILSNYEHYIRSVEES